jgi:hypothetical protein
MDSRSAGPLPAIEDAESPARLGGSVCEVQVRKVETEIRELRAFFDLRDGQLGLGWHRGIVLRERRAHARAALWSVERRGFYKGPKQPLSRM